VNYEAHDLKFSKSIKYLDFALEVYKRLEDSYEGTPAIKKQSCLTLELCAKFKM
jgi:hypothetical protein